LPAISANISNDLVGSVVGIRALDVGRDVPSFVAREQTGCGARAGFIFDIACGYPFAVAQ
jgi:hypothetical protein